MFKSKASQIRGFQLFHTSKLSRCPPSEVKEDDGADVDEQLLAEAARRDADRWQHMAPAERRQDLESELKEFKWLLSQAEASQFAPEFDGYDQRIAEMLDELKPVEAVLKDSQNDRALVDSDNEDRAFEKKSDREPQRGFGVKNGMVKEPSEKVSAILQDLLPDNKDTLGLQNNTIKVTHDPLVNRTSKHKQTVPQVVDPELVALLDEDLKRSSPEQSVVSTPDERSLSLNASKQKAHPKSDSFPVLFEDSHIIAVAKPPGIPVIPSRAQNSDDMLSKLRDTYGQLRPVLTLDSQSSGIILFARTSDAFGILSKSVETGELTNTLIGWIEGKLNKQEGNINIPLQLGRKSRMRPADGWVAGPEHKLADCVVQRNVPVHQLSNAVNAKVKLPAVTRFILSRVFRLPHGKTITRVLFRPLTHRQHQIRVHMRAVELPLLVDNIYGFNSTLRANQLGSGSPALSTLSLHNMDVTFKHPTTGARVKISCPLSSCNPDLKRLDDWLSSSCPKAPNEPVDASLNR